MSLNVQNVHRRLTHIPAVACDSLSQRCQWLSSVTQTKLTKVHVKTRELVSASVAAFVKTPVFPQT